MCYSTYRKKTTTYKKLRGVVFHQHVVCHQHAKSSVQSRDSLAGHVVTASAYDEQHYVAARFCVNRSVLRKQGLHF
jgi:hypothetical protein